MPNAAFMPTWNLAALPLLRFKHLQDEFFQPRLYTWEYKEKIKSGYSRREKYIKKEAYSATNFISDITNSILKFIGDEEKLSYFLLFFIFLNTIEKFLPELLLPLTPQMLYKCLRHPITLLKKKKKFLFSVTYLSPYLPGRNPHFFMMPELYWIYDLIIMCSDVSNKFLILSVFLEQPLHLPCEKKRQGKKIQ